MAAWTCRGLLAASILLSVSQVVADEFPRIVKPVLVWTDTDSNLIKPYFARCDTRTEWVAIWQKHQGRDADPYLTIPAYPEIDFDSYMVIAIFHGKSSMNSGIWVRQVIEEKTCTRIRYQPSWYQISTGAYVPDSKADQMSREKTFDTRSFAFVL